MNPFISSKILHHLDRVLEWRTTGISRPVTYELDMTNACNSRCSFCFGFADPADTTSSITLPQARDIIRQIRAMGGKGITFTGGGEPLCNPATIAAVRYARSLGLDIGFITNGLLLDDTAARTLVECCTWVRVSIDAGSPEMYAVTHGLNGHSFRRAQRGIAALVAAKRARGSAVTIGTGFITYPDVVGGMRPFTLLSRRLGVDYAQFRPLLKRFRQQELNDRVDQRVLDELQRCSALATRSFSVLSSVHKYAAMLAGDTGRSYAACHGHHFAAVIAADRRMYVCCHMRGMPQYCIGDLSRRSLRQIWRSAGRRQAYTRIDFRDCPLLCRCDGFNAILWDISRGTDHVNFL